jgi:hypothetical protein
MKNISIILLILLSIIAVGVSCAPKTAPARTGLLTGGVTIGPLKPVEIPGQNDPVPPEVFSSRKILIYDNAGKELIIQADINQIKQTSSGYYAVQLEQGTYTVDTTRVGIGGGAGLPQEVTITAGQTTVLDIDIDTGIR